MPKTVWIDLENSPHVPFFLPWISWLREDGHEVLLTARDLSQTHELLALHGQPFTPIGGHAGGGRLGKAMRTIRRATALSRWAGGRGIGLALGHGSRAQVVAAAGMRIPSLTFIDYEFVSLRLFGWLCRRVFVPDAVPASTLLRRGIPVSRLVSYPGFKEQVYLDPERDRPQPDEPPLVLVRPPARQAHYHSPRSEVLYRRMLDRLVFEGKGCQVLLLPRYKQDENELRALASRYPHVSVAEHALDGRELLLRASLVVSGGGTMVREAAVLGIPAASYFGGPVGGVDRALRDAGRLRLLRTEGDVDALPLPGGGGTGPNSSAVGAAIPECRAVREFLRAEVTRWLGR